MQWLLSILGSLIPSLVKGWFTKDAGVESGQLQVTTAGQQEVIKNAEYAKTVSDTVDSMSPDERERLRLSLNE